MRLNSLDVILIAFIMGVIFASFYAGKDVQQKLIDSTNIREIQNVKSAQQ